MNDALDRLNGVCRRPESSLRTRAGLQRIINLVKPLRTMAMDGQRDRA
jgi:hypothetical protein